jgi:hypothetical protein
MRNGGREGKERLLGEGRGLHAGEGVVCEGERREKGRGCSDGRGEGLLRRCGWGGKGVSGGGGEEVHQAV